MTAEDPVAVESDQAFMLLSSEALSGSSTARTLQFQGQLRGRSILILVDSGSSHSFLSAEFASQLDDLQPLLRPLSVRVADGGSVCCNSELRGAEWAVQGYKFHSTLRVIPLGSYDMIASMD